MCWRRRWFDVLEGKDHLANAAWTLALYPQHLNSQQHPPPAAAAVLQVAIWLAPAAAAGVGDAGGLHRPHQGRGHVPLLPVSTGITAQWIALPKQQQQQQDTAGSSSAPGSSKAVKASAGVQWPILDLGPKAALLPVWRPVGGAMLLQMHLQWQFLISGLSLTIRQGQQQQQQHSSSGSSTAVPPSTLPQQHHPSTISEGSICWQPAAVYSSRWGGIEHVTVIKHNCSRAG